MLLTLLYHLHGPIIIVAIMSATAQIAASHIVRYTHTLNDPITRNLQTIAITLIIMGITISLTAVLEQTDPQAAAGHPTFTKSEYTLVAMTLIPAWTAATLWNIPLIHIPAWTLTAIMTTVTAASMDEGNALTAIIILSTITACAHLASTFIPLLQRCTMYSYTTRQAGASRGTDAAWLMANIILLTG